MLDPNSVARAKEDFSKLRNRLDELDYQLIIEEKNNRQLKLDLRLTEQMCEQLNREVEHLKKPLAFENAFSLSTDDEIIKLQSIHKAEMRAKEYEITALRQQLEEAKSPITETELYLKNAALKAELKSKDAQIDVLKQQIGQLEQHLQLKK